MKAMETLLYEKPHEVVQDRVWDFSSIVVRAPADDVLLGGGLDDIYHMKFRLQRRLERQIMEAS